MKSFDSVTETVKSFCSVETAGASEPDDAESALFEQLTKETSANTDVIKITPMTYNEWAEQQGINHKNSVADSGNDDIIKAVSGGRITNPYGKAATAHAERYYGLVRNMKNDVSRIAKNTGFPEEDIQRIKNFIFLEKHDLGHGEPEYFAPDFAMAQSWQRLIDGKAKPHDLTLLRHETLENKLMDSGISQSEAHIQASKKYNYTKGSDDYYGALKKHKDK